MSWKLRVLISAMLLAPPVALPLGLGEIRLGSALNEPLTAEIELVAATPEELTALQAQLASRDLFERYGLDRPAYLDSLEFRVGRGQDGRSVIQVRSREAVSEPFLSFLVDVSWPRGRLLREYTVLLDPPVFAPQGQQAAPAPIVAPKAESAAPRPAPAPAAAPGSEPVAAAPAPPAEGPSTYRVERGDTLYKIAGSLAPGDRATTQRMMIGLFRTNPEAFQGNINVLRAGAILRVPGSEELSAIGAGEASAEVSRQISAWRASAGAAESARLRLVTPEEGVPEAGAGKPVSGAAAESQVGTLQREIEEQRRLLELKNQELAELQRKLASAKAVEKPVAAAPEKPAPEETAVAPEFDTGAAVPPVEEARKPEVVAKPKPKPAAKPKPAPEAEGPSFLDRLTDNWLFLLGAAALVLVGGLGYGYVRRRREQDVDVALKGFELPVTAPVPTETTRLRTLPAAADETAEIERVEDEGFFVEEPERPAARAKPEPAPAVSQEETISTEAALDLDQADPLAEADFHMAYGLYDQACDLIRMALKKQPDRNDLKQKLAEIHFVAGDTQAFLGVARDLRKTLGSGGDWDRVVIMGRQLAPDETLFAGNVQSAGVDVSLEGGENRVDLELLSAPSGDESMDLDLGQTLAASDSNAVTGERDMLEFNLDEGPAAFSTTQKISPREGPATVEMPTLELPSSETPTVETPALRQGGSDTVRERVSSSEFTGSLSPDATAEMAIDDLGLDVGDFEGLPESADEATIQATYVEETLRLEPRDESTRQMPKSAGTDATGIARVSEAERTALLASMEGGNASGIDLDVGSAMEDSGTGSSSTASYAATEKLPQLSDLEPVTMSEVGTKLDLARAYMDMGDPDGARNILQEVLAEGSASQKQEARRLIDSLPGA
jgi:pilus assembly protein FimV